MSTTPAPSSAAGTTASGHAAASTAHGGAHRRAGHAATGSDLFANLMSLLSPGSDAAADPLGTSLPGKAGTTADAPGGDTAQDPLAGLLAWPADPTAAALLEQAQASVASGSSTQTHHKTSPTGTSADSGTEALGARRAAPTNGNAMELSARTLPNGRTDSVAGQGTMAASAPPAGQEGVLSAGLQRLATPETLDADTLSAMGLSPAAADKTSTPPVLPGTEAGPTSGPNSPNGLTGSVRISTWRSTTTLAQGNGASHNMAAGSTAAPLARLPVSDEPRTGTASSPLNVSDERLTATRVASADGVDAGPVDATGHPVRERDTGTGAHTGPGLPEVGAASTGSGQGDLTQSGQGSNNPQGDDAGQAMAQGMNGTEDPEASHWGAQHLRHAHVRVGDAREGVIDIQLSMAGQEVKVAFHTDDAQTRASLAQDASASLGDLLQRSGIELGGVSVGAQGQQHQPSGDPAGQRAATPLPNPGRSGGSGAVDATPAPVTQRPRSDGSRPLDLFV